jgi:hypothetical protein
MEKRKFDVLEDRGVVYMEIPIEDLSPIIGCLATAPVPKFVEQREEGIDRAEAMGTHAEEMAMHFQGRAELLQFFLGIARKVNKT